MHVDAARCRASLIDPAGGQHDKRVSRAYSCCTLCVCVSMWNVNFGDLKEMRINSMRACNTCIICTATTHTHTRIVRKRKGIRFRSDPSILECSKCALNYAFCRNPLHLIQYALPLARAICRLWVFCSCRWVHSAARLDTSTVIIIDIRISNIYTVDTDACGVVQERITCGQFSWTKIAIFVFIDVRIKPQNAFDGYKLWFIQCFPIPCDAHSAPHEFDLNASANVRYVRACACLRIEINSLKLVDTVDTVDRPTTCGSAKEIEKCQTYVRAIGFHMCCVEIELGAYLIRK